MVGTTASCKHTTICRFFWGSGSFVLCILDIYIPTSVVSKALAIHDFIGETRRFCSRRKELHYYYYICCRSVKLCFICCHQVHAMISATHLCKRPGSSIQALFCIHLALHTNLLISQTSTYPPMHAGREGRRKKKEDIPAKPPCVIVDHILMPHK